MDPLTKHELALKIVETQDEVKNISLERDRLQNILLVDMSHLEIRLNKEIKAKDVSIIAFNNNLYSLDNFAKNYLKTSEKYQEQLTKLSEYEAKLYDLNELWRMEKYVGGGNCKVLTLTPETCIRISNLPEKEREALSKWIMGQTTPYFEGEDPQDFIYPWDYENFKEAFDKGKVAFIQD